MFIKYQLLITIFLFSSTICKSQYLHDFFDAQQEITWLGIDFSQVKLIGDFSQIWGLGKKDGAQIKNIYFPAWNNLFFNEPEKYDLRALFKKEDVRYKIPIIAARNEATNTEAIFESKASSFTEKDIRSIVYEYDIKGKGLAAALIAECFNKTIDESIFHFVLIDMSNDYVVLHQKIRAKPGGFGIRNYWAKTIYDVIDLIKIRYYKLWKKRL